jgi:hypothetical protein
MQRWTEEDFDSLSWHDNHVHAMELANFNEENGTCDLVLMIDHILDWIGAADRTISFRVAPALLTFHDVFALRVELDYARVSAGMTPFSIDRIEREPLSYGSFRWKIAINWPEGSITFEAPRFTQQLTGEPVESSTQALHDS